MAINKDIIIDAEETGFEPAIPFGIPAFQASALNRSATPPKTFFIKNVQATNFLIKIGLAISTEQSYKISK